MDWKYLFTSFEGRINRAPFWTGVLILFVAQLVVGWATGFSANPASMAGSSMLGMIVALLLIYPALAVYAKRCHDRNKSAWWLLLLLIPVVGLIWAIVDLGIMEGTKGANRYGPDPLA